MKRVFALAAQCPHERVVYCEWPVDQSPHNCVCARLDYSQNEWTFTLCVLALDEIGATSTKVRALCFVYLLVLRCVKPTHERHMQRRCRYSPM